MTIKKKKKSNNLIYILVIFIAGIAFLLFKVFGSNTGTFTKGEYIYIPTSANYDKLIQLLEDGGFVNDINSFELIAKQVKLPAHIHAGKFHLVQGMSNYTIIKLLHSGKQTPVKLVINKIRTKQDLITLVATNLECDSNTLLQLFADPKYLAQFGLDTNTVIAGIIPDTYDFFWNTTADKAFRKIVKNYVKFWDAARKTKAKTKGLTPIQVTTLASIVEEESNIIDDKPNIASVYLNRIKKGMKLQADPTVKFAVGDFTIKRITGKLLNTNSLYNTYRYAGLPPGPICTPTISSINAVLDAPQTTYLYFCANADFSGSSVFATTFDQQKKNALLYWKALNEKGIH